MQKGFGSGKRTVTHIFLTFGAPHVLQSDNGREFTAGIITELASLCQTNKMLMRGKGILPPLKVGENVLMSIPSVDRGRGDAANLLSVIMKKKRL